MACGIIVLLGLVVGYSLGWGSGYLMTVSMLLGYAMGRSDGSEKRG